jgi:DNA-directed RNA polymerase omega subunit
LTTQHALLDAAVKKIGNRYLTTMLIAKRIRQLYHGAPALVECDEDESHFTIAVREIAEGHLTIEPTIGSPSSTLAPLHMSNETAEDVISPAGVNDTQ